MFRKLVSLFGPEHIVTQYNTLYIDIYIDNDDDADNGAAADFGHDDDDDNDAHTAAEDVDSNDIGDPRKSQNIPL